MACDNSNSPVPEPPELTLDSISVTGPGKIAYIVGDSFSVTGLTVTAAYSDESTKTVTGYTLSWSGGALAAITAETGSKTVTVTYQDKTATFTITVAPDTTPPGKVNGLTAAPGNGKARLTWADPADADLASIEISFSPAAGVTQPVSVPKGRRLAIIDGLTNGTTYTFTVKAKDAAGNLNAGETATAKPETGLNDDLTPPAAVSDFQVKAGDTNVTLTWTNPANDDLDKIKITWVPAHGPSGGSKDITNGDEFYTVTGLANKTPYTFTVVAVDNATPEANESAGVSANATPLAPTAQVTVDFSGLPKDEEITLNTPNALSWASNNYLYVSVIDGSFTLYKWVLDGVTLPENTSYLLRNAGSFSIKTHRLTVFVTKGGVEYAKSLTFTITN